MKAITENGEPMHFPGMLTKKEFKDTLHANHKFNKRELSFGLRFSKLQHHFKDPTAHLQ